MFSSQIKQQESLDLMDPVRPQLEESNVDPFSQTLDSFNLTVPGVNEVMYDRRHNIVR